MPKAPELVTVGHGRLDRAELSALLRTAEVATLIDIRRYPASRHNPDVSSDEMRAWMPSVGIEYRWDVRLGGRRKLPPGSSPDTWWKVESFRAYAAHTRTSEFADGLAAVLASAGTGRTAVMCSETVWWRCHRRIVADVAQVGHGLTVRHLMPNGSLRDHPSSDGARCLADGQLVWDGPDVAGER